MSRLILLHFIGLALLALCACADPMDDLSIGAEALEGTWMVYALQDRHGCPDLGSLAPVEPGLVTIERDGDDWVLTPRATRRSVRYRAVGADAWSRSVAAPLEGCEVEAESLWSFDGVSETRFQARFEGRIRVVGVGEGCGYSDETCDVGYTVAGTRMEPARTISLGAPGWAGGEDSRWSR